MRSRRPRHDRGHDPRPTAPGLPWENPGALADAELGARLEQALREGPGSGHVDVAQLLRGTRQATTKRARARRTALIAAAAVAVGAVPVGLQTARWMSPGPTVPGTSVATGPSPSGRPIPSAQPSQALPTSRFADLGDDPTAVAYEIPDEAAFARTDLSIPLVQDLGQYRWIPVVQGQQCNDSRFRKLEQPIAGRSWIWAGVPAGGSAELQVDLNVTGWAGEKAADLQLGLVRRDLGACRFAERISPVSTTSGDWTAVGFGPDGKAQVHAVSVVSGGLIVGLTVTTAQGTELALTYAEKLVQTAARNLERSGLVKQLLAEQVAGRRLVSPGPTRPPGTDPNPGANAPRTATTG